jgi:parallel beta-helix repeat protein
MLTESSYRNKVTDSTAKCTIMAANVQSYGFESRGTYNILANCIAMNSFHCGFKIGGNYNIVEGCVANNSGECGFVTYYGLLANNTFLTGNIFDGCISVNGKGKFPLVAGGIRIWRSANTIVSNCLCFNNTFFDIHLDSSINCTLNANLCFSKTQYQIYVENGADNLLVGNKGVLNDTGTNTKTSP